MAEYGEALFRDITNYQIAGARSAALLNCSRAIENY